MCSAILFTDKFYPATKKQLWLGYSQTNEHAPWTWTDMTCSKYANWGCGEPNNAGWQGEDCMAVAFGSTNAGRWNDDYCGNDKQFACEMNAPLSKNLNAAVC